MKKLIFILIIFSVTTAYSYDTSAAKYYPLAVGNCWTYSYSSYPFGSSGIYMEKVTGTILTNNHQYYIITTIDHWNIQSTRYVRIDSAKNSVMVYDQNGCSWLNHEYIMDSLSARLSDSSFYNCSLINTIIDTANYTIFNLTKKAKRSLRKDNFESGAFRTLAKDIGLASYTTFGHTNSTYYTLRGCIINNILYGDTTSVTEIKQISTEIPDHFSLSQNYPNPFNPVTLIKFDIPAVGNGRDRSVKLIIYDVLGREVATLVNQQMQPGSYSVDWDGTNYTSGVYFYKLSINNEQLAARKMALIK